jgi:hypothetical protein
MFGMNTFSLAKRYMKLFLLMQRIALSIMAILAVANCSTGRAPASPRSSTPSRADSVPTHIHSSNWTPRFTTGTRRYFIRDSSVISISNDTTSQPIPIESTMIYSISATNVGDSLMLTSHIDSLRVSSRLQANSNTDTGSASDFHTIFSKQGHLTTILDRARTGCTGANTSASTRIGELITSFPGVGLKVGDKWTDTTSITSCHGKIPLIQQAIREYELLDLSSCLQHDAVKVRRTVSDTFTGSSTESNNHLSASGSGTASAILCLQRDTGALIESNGKSRSDLIVVTTRGTFPFTQNVNTHIESQ